MHGSTASTGGSAQFIVVNGPIRTALGMNATHNVLANGNRANATIGRAVRLVLINLLGVIPGQLDRSTLGHPGKYTLCIAEDEEDSPWTPLAQMRGVPPGMSAITVFACEAPRQLMNEWTHDPEEILATFAAEMRHNMLTYSVWSGNYAMVIPKQLARIDRRGGMAEGRYSRVYFPSRQALAPRVGNSGQSQYRRPQRGAKSGVYGTQGTGGSLGRGGGRTGGRVWRHHSAVAGVKGQSHYASD